MKNKSTTKDAGSSVSFEMLEGWVRGRIQDMIQDLLEQEVTELPGRAKSERRLPVDAPKGYRNGYGKPRKFTLSTGTVTVHRPRVRGLEQRFESRVLPLFVRRTAEVGELIPELYLHGLAEGDFDLALRGLLGEDAPLSASTVARLKDKWQGDYEAWNARRLDELEPVYLWVDGVYIKAGLEKQKAAVLVVIAGLKDGRKEVLAVTPGHRESTPSWSEVLRDLRDRGLAPPCLVVGDGHLGIWGALRNVFPEAEEQRCWNHKIMNAVDTQPKKQQPAARKLLRQIPQANTRREAEKATTSSQDWCRKEGFDKAAETLDRDWEQMVTFYRFPKGHWKHLRTTTPVESPFAALRLRTDAAKRYKKVPRATAVVWKMLLVAEKKFRRLDAPEMLAEVWHGTRFADGIAIKPEPNRVQEAGAEHDTREVAA